jgi:hypothetical protein
MYITKKQTNSKNALCKKILKTNAETPKEKILTEDIDLDNHEAETS